MVVSTVFVLVLRAQLRAELSGLNALFDAVPYLLQGGARALAST
jgi:hypothetical protein